MIFQKKNKKSATKTKRLFGGFSLLGIHLVFFVVLVINYLFFDLFGKTVRFLERVFDILCMVKIGGGGRDVQRIHPCLGQISNVTQAKIGVVLTHIIFETSPRELDWVKHIMFYRQAIKQSYI